MRIVIFDNGCASVANEEGMWWCGHEDGWVHESSSAWVFACGRIQNVVWESPEAALGWLRASDLVSDAR